MASGDTVTVVVRTGQVETMTVRKAGRRITVTWPRANAKNPMIVVAEVTRRGTPTGTSIQVRPDDLAPIREDRLDERPAPRRGKARQVVEAREIPGVKSNGRPGWNTDD